MICNHSQLARTHLKSTHDSVTLVDPDAFASAVAAAKAKRISNKKQQLNDSLDSDISIKILKCTKRHISCLERQARLWNFKAASVQLTGVKSSEGHITRDHVGIAEELKHAWSNTFTTKGTISPLSHRVLEKWAVKFDFSEVTPPTRDDYRRVVKVSADKATGPDGIPNSAWRATGDEGIDTLKEAGDSLASGDKPPTWFNSSIMLFTPKGEDESDSYSERVRVASATRPLSLKNTDNKIVGSVYNYKLSGPVASSRCKVQQGFVKEGQPLSNPVVLDTHARQNSYKQDWHNIPIMAFYDLCCRVPKSLSRMDFPGPPCDSVSPRYN